MKCHITQAQTLAIMALGWMPGEMGRVAWLIREVQFLRSELARVRGKAA